MASSGLPVQCQAEIRFNLGLSAAGCCHAGYSKDSCEAFAKEAEEMSQPVPPPQIVFVDACAGRLGYVLYGRACEATLALP
jgi:hypothetical protein